MSFADFVRDKTVVLVGPAPSIIGTKQGKYIDSFDIIIRLNKALPIPEHLKEDIGSKTDILYNCLNPKPHCGGKINFEVLKKNNVEYLCCPYPPIYPFKKNIDAFKKNNKGFIKFKHFDTDYYLRLKKWMHTNPNTGVCAILDILRYPIKSLYVTGITFFKGGYYKEYRNQNEKQVLALMAKYNFHQQEGQKKYMKKVLQRDERITMDKTLKDIVAKIN